MERSVKEKNRKSLEAVLQTTHEGLIQWSEEKKSHLEFVTRQEQIQVLAKKLLALSKNNRSIVGSPELDQLRQTFKFYQNTFDHQGFTFISREGLNVASLRDNSIGTNNIIFKSNPKAFTRALNGETVFVYPMISDIALEGHLTTVKGSTLPPTMFFLAPVLDSNGKVMCLVSARFNPKEGFSRTMKQGRVGDSGETYSFNVKGQLLSGSRFEDQLLQLGLIEPGEGSILSIQVKDPGENLIHTGIPTNFSFDGFPLTLMAASASQGNKSSNMDGYRDYRGVTVVGAWLWDHNLNIGITTEIDYDEAMETYFLARRSFLLVIGISAFLGIGVIIAILVISLRNREVLEEARTLLEQRVAQRTRELSKSEAQLRTLVNNIPGAVFRMSIENNTWLFSYMSPYISKISGLSADQFRDQDLTYLNRLLSSEEQVSFEREFTTWAQSSDKVFLREIQFVESTQKVHWIAVQAELFKDEDNTYIDGVFLDITERKKALEKAEDASRAKSDFLAIMSHEIRTPMNGVLGMLEIALGETLEKGLQKNLTIAFKSAQSLLSLINDILDYSKVEAGKLQLEEINFDLRDLIGDIGQTMDFQAAEKGIDLTVDLSGVPRGLVRGDPNRLRQVLINLVGNAIKFTETGEVSISASIYKSSARHWMFMCSIEDSGIGIPEDKFSALFDRFSQVDESTSRKFGGSGLGLAICKRLCNLMGGDINVSSTLGEGSCFTIDLLLKTSMQDSANMSHSFSQNPTTALVMEAGSNRDILVKQLKKWGAKVKTFNTGNDLTPLLESETSEAAYVLVDQDLDKDLSLSKDLSQQRDKIKKVALLSSHRHPPFDPSLKIDDRINIPGSLSDLFDFIEGGANETKQTSPLSLVPSQKSDLQWPPDTLILIVEDNEINQEVIQGVLSKFGLSCELASNGLIALEMLQRKLENPYKLILMDCQMPELDGYETSSRIREGEAGELYTEIPIIALTAHAMAEERDKCLAAGMSDYLTKPIKSKKLREKIHHWLVEVGKHINTRQTG